MRMIGNDQKNNGQKFWEILERIIGKISSIIGAGLVETQLQHITLTDDSSTGGTLTCYNQYIINTH